MKEFIIILAITGVIVAVCAYFGAQNQKRMIESGKIIKRSYNFMEEENTFTTKATYSDFINAFKAHKVENDGVGYSSTQSGLAFTNSSWKAELYKIKTAEGEPFQYVFHFSSWDTHKGVVVGYNSMNILLTAIEKSFLEVDNGTQVTREKMKLKTKHSFF